MQAIAPRNGPADRHAARGGARCGGACGRSPAGSCRRHAGRVAGPAAASAERATVALAEACGARVEVTSRRSERSRLFAEPSGAMTLDTSLEPRWLDVATVRGRTSTPACAGWSAAWWRRGDPGRRAVLGRWQRAACNAPWGRAPALAVVAPVRCRLRWWRVGLRPTPVCCPEWTSCSGRPRRGYPSHVLIIRDAKAAANPAVRRMRLKLGEDGVDVGLRTAGRATSAAHRSGWGGTRPGSGQDGSATNADLDHRQLDPVC